MRISNYWASATVTVILRKGGGQNEITVGVIAGSSLNVYADSLSQYTECRKILLLVFYGWRSGGTDYRSLIPPSPPLELAACPPFPLLSMPLPAFHSCLIQAWI